MFKLKKQLFAPNIKSLLGNPKETIQQLNQDLKLADMFLEHFIDEPDEVTKNIPLLLLFIKNNPNVLLNHKQGYKFFDLLKENDLLELQFPAISSLMNAAILAQSKKTKKDPATLSYIPQDIRRKQDQLAEALLRWIDIEKKDAMERTAIHLSAQSGHIALLKYVLERNPKHKKKLLSALDIEKKTALHLAANSKELGVVEYLIEQGSKIDAQDHEKKTPLHYASGSGAIKIIRFFIEKGANPKQKDIKGKVPLIFAIQHGKEEAAKYLSTLSDLNQKDDLGKLPLHHACQSKNSALVRFLLSKTKNIDSKDKNGKAPLHIAAIHGFVPAIQAFHQNNANLNLADNDKKTPLHIACMHKQTAFVEALLKKKVKIDAKDIKKRSALFYAVEFFNPNLTELLLKKKAKLDLVDESLRSALHIAAEHTNFAQIKLLINHLAPLNVQDEIGLTALHFAAAKNDEKIVKYLIENGAEIHLQDAQGKTPAHFAAAMNNPDLMEWLAQTEMIHLVDNQKNTILHVALMHKMPSIKLVAHLIKKKVHLDAKNNKQNVALHMVMHTQSSDLIEQIAKHTLFIDSKDQQGKTALHLACIHAKVDDGKIVEMLLKLKANPQCKDKQGKLAYQYLPKEFKKTKAILTKALHEFDGNGQVLDAVKLKDESKLHSLLEAKADPNIINAHGETPLFWAVQYENIQMVKDLVAHGANPLLGKPAFFIAIEKQSIPLIQDLMEAKTPWQPLIHKQPLLAPLIREKKSEILSNILPFINKKCPELIEQKKMDHASYLHLAIQKKLSIEIIKELAHPALLQIKDAKGLTPLKLAQKVKYQAAVKLLS